MELRKIEASNTILTLLISGDFDAHGSKEALPHIDQVLSEDRHKEIEVDFKHVSFLDSSGVGAIVYFYKRLIERDRAMRIENVRVSSPGETPDAPRIWESPEVKLNLTAVYEPEASEVRIQHLRLVGAPLDHDVSGVVKDFPGKKPYPMDLEVRPRGDLRRLHGLVPGADQIVGTLGGALKVVLVGQDLGVGEIQPVHRCQGPHLFATGRGADDLAESLLHGLTHRPGGQDPLHRGQQLFVDRDTRLARHAPPRTLEDIKS